MHRFLIALLMFHFVSMPAVGSADSIKLKDGRVLKGKVVERSATSVKFLMEGRSTNATLTLQLSDIESIEEGLTVREEYEVRVKELDAGSYPQQLGLADWCLENKLEQFAVERFKAAAALKPAEAKPIQALRKLGYHRVKMTWLSPPEFMRELGYEQKDGKWIHPAESPYRNSLGELTASEAALATAKSDYETAAIQAARMKVEADFAERELTEGPAKIEAAKGETQAAERALREADRAAIDAKLQVARLTTLLEVEEKKEDEGLPSDSNAVRRELRGARNVESTAQTALELEEGRLARAQAELRRIEASVATSAARLPKLKEGIPAADEIADACFRRKADLESKVNALRVEVLRKKEAATKEIEGIRARIEDDYGK
ncbi:MAG: hypothetical protein IT452_21075 [Planctomycetia bacterium]|nr:hypothetical protein [Planctomycetia bacterium]